MIDLVDFDEATLVVSEIAHWRFDRGHSFTNLIVTMKDGAAFKHCDWNGSSYDLDKKLRAAVMMHKTAKRAGSISLYDTAPNEFASWSTASLAVQCRLQASEQLDPEFSRFMTALSDRLQTAAEGTA